MSNPHSDHPGHSAIGCPLRQQVNAKSARSMNGYRCDHTGGHCFPGDYCQERVKIRELRDLALEYYR